MEHCTICDIVHDNNSGCPLCEAEEAIKDLEKERDDLENEVSELQNQL